MLAFRYPCLLFGICLFLFSAQGQEPSGKAADPQLIGVWNAVKMEVAGKSATEADLKFLRFTFTPDRLIMRGNFKDNRESTFTYSLDLKETPKRLEFNLLGEQKRSVGIYELKGDTLIVCTRRGDSDKPAPTSFTTSPGSDHIMITFKRQTPSTNESTMDKQLTGDWQAISMETDGKPALKSEVDRVQFRFTDGRLLIDEGKTNRKPKEYELTLDLKKEPRHIDIKPVGETKKAMLGIYQVNDAELKLCFHQKGSRPTSFQTTPDSDQVCVTFRRIKPVATTSNTANDAGLQGVWKVRSAILSGNKLPDEAIASTRFTFRDDQLLIVRPAGDQETHSFRTRSGTIAELDFWKKDAKPVAAIYQLNGNELMICESESVGEARPTEFSSAANSRRILLTLERLKE